MRSFSYNHPEKDLVERMESIRSLAGNQQGADD